MILTFLLLAALARAPEDVAVETCPADNPQALGIVQRFLSSEGTLAERQAQGMAHVGPGSVRILTDAQDAAMCQWLNENVSLALGRYPQELAYFAADGYYFVVGTWVVPPGRLWLSFSPLIVLDAQKNLVGTYAR